MLAPIITKDMKLFPSRPLPPNVRNVRSRAQTLDDRVLHPGSRNRIRTKPAHRVCQSMDHLPLHHSASKKKPTTLAAIVEGVEMRSDPEILRAHQDSVDVVASSGSTYSLPPSNDPALLQLSTTAVTASACSLLKDPPSLPSPSITGKQTVNKDTAEKQTTTTATTTAAATSATRIVVKWLSSLRSKPKDEDFGRNGETRRLSNPKS